MGKKFACDWDYAFLLYSQGLTYKEIAQQIGASLEAVKQHSSRKKWSHRVTTARQAITTAVTKSVQAGALTIKDRTERWVDATVGDIERTVDVLSKLKVPKNLKGLREHEEVWGLHVKRGRSTLGIDQAGAQIQVNVGVFEGKLRPGNNSQAIDVETVDEESPSD